MFKALLVKKDDLGYRTELSEVSEDQLPEGEVLVEVLYSTLNYKDALAITGKAPVISKFPMIPGIDLAGMVLESQDGRFQAGDAVLLNGWGVGEGHFGGLAEKARLKADWLLKLPEGFDMKQSMAVGTAGYTAALSVVALLDAGIKPTSGKILVTGANGGVGSVAVILLASLGFDVVASTGRMETTDELKELGATEILDRRELSEKGKPLQRSIWAGAVDSVGGHTLANICAKLNYNGVVTACGLAGGADLPATVMPFILRGVTLIGIDSVMAPMDRRVRAWKLLSENLDKTKLNTRVREISLEEAITVSSDLLAGKVKGRVVVKLR